MTAASDNSDAISISDGAWRVDPERSEIGFAAKSLWGMSAVRGTFGDCHGSLTVGAQAVSGELAVNARSLDTGNRRRDRHLRSSDFLDTERHPWIVFRLAAVAARGRGATFAGRLEIGDTDTRLELPVEVDATAYGDIHLQVATTISRSRAGVAWNWLGMIAEDTSVHAQITLTRAEQTECVTE